MDKEERNLLDKLFQSKLYDFEMETDPNDWDSISRHLDKNKSVPSHKIIYYWAAAAVIALLIMTGGFYLYNHGNKQQTLAKDIKEYTQREERLFTEQQKTAVTVIPKSKKASKAIASVTTILATKPVTTTFFSSIKTMGKENEEGQSSVTEDIQPKKIEKAISDSVETKSQTEVKGEKLFSNAQASSLLSTEKKSQRKDKKSPVRRWGLGMGGGSLSTEFSSITSFGNMANNYTYMDDIPLGLSSVSSYQTADRDINSSYLQNFTLNNINSFTAKTNIHHNRPISFGLGVSYMLNNRFYLLSGINYTYLSSSWEANDDYHIKTTQKLHFLGVPLSISYKIAEWHRLNFYTAAGGMAEINIAGELCSKLQNTEKGTEESSSKSIRMKPWQWSINGRIGVSYPLWNFLSIYTEAGIGYYFDNGSEIETIHNEKPFDAALQAGFRLGF